VTKVSHYLSAKSKPIGTNYLVQNRKEISGAAIQENWQKDQIPWLPLGWLVFNDTSIQKVIL